MKKLDSLYEQERLLFYLSLIPGIAPKDMWYINDRYQTLTDLLANPPKMPEKLNLSVWENLIQPSLVNTLTEKINLLDEHNISPIVERNPKFISQLTNNPDFPPIYWLKENLHASQMQKAIAIIGAHDATSFGMHLSWQIAKKLSQQELFIISGGALGIDMAAHFGALTNNHPTLVILPMGIMTYLEKVAYKFEPYELDQKTIVFSQFTPYDAWKTENALSRNNTIAQLAKAVVVIEAKSWRSGTMSTVNHAKKLGKPIFVVKHLFDSDANWAYKTLPDEGIAIPLSSENPAHELINYLLDLNIL